MRWAGELDRAIASAMGKAYGPWLALVATPPGCGVLWACWPGEHAEAANDGRY